MDVRSLITALTKDIVRYHVRQTQSGAAPEHQEQETQRLLDGIAGCSRDLRRIELQRLIEESCQSKTTRKTFWLYVLDQIEALTNYISFGTDVDQARAQLEKQLTQFVTTIQALFSISAASTLTIQHKEAEISLYGFAPYGLAPSFWYSTGSYAAELMQNTLLSTLNLSVKSTPREVTLTLQNLILSERTQKLEQHIEYLDRTVKAQEDLIAELRRQNKDPSKPSGAATVSCQPTRLSQGSSLLNTLSRGLLDVLNEPQDREATLNLGQFLNMQ